MVWWHGVCQMNAHCGRHFLPRLGNAVKLLIVTQYHLHDTDDIIKVIGLQIRVTVLQTTFRLPSKTIWLFLSFV